MRGVFLDAETVDRGDLDWTALEGGASWTFYPRTTPKDLGDRLADAEVAITNKVELDASALDRAPALGLIAVAATGVNNVAVAAARERGIAVVNVPAYATPSVTQHAFGLLLALATHIPDYDAAVRAGQWSASPHFCFLAHPVRELAGMTLGIVGYGDLGSQVARIAEAFGMDVRIAQLPGRPQRPDRTPWPQLLAEVDVLSLHCPLTQSTRGLIGEAELASMRSDSLLINTARGALVDEHALAEALRHGELGGAGVDVLSQEPPPADHPLLADDIPNLIRTPHVAWASQPARQRLVDELAANVEAFRAGQRRNRVD